VLALHGFGGTCREVEIVVRVAKQLGLGAEAPLLPGHGSNAAELAASRWADWYDASEAALGRLTADGHPAIVVGLSLGSLIATHLAVLQADRVAAVGLLGNAFWLPRPVAASLRAARLLHAPNAWIPKPSSDILDPEARADHLTYRVQPLHAAQEVHQAGLRARGLAPRIRVPVLIAHGTRDRVCPPENARRVAALLRTRDVRVVMLPRSRHVVTRDVERDRLGEELREFFERVRGKA
jgi:carboxylesterase